MQSALRKHFFPSKAGTASGYLSKCVPSPLYTPQPTGALPHQTTAVGSGSNRLVQLEAMGAAAAATSVCLPHRRPAFTAEYGHNAASSWPAQPSPVLRRLPPSSCDVFINHRGADTKRTLAALLYDRLVQQNVPTFLDSRSMKPGDKLFETINTAIQGCKVGIAIFSPRYCESYFCLHELALMVERRKKVIPIFCDISPSDLLELKEGQHPAEDLDRFRQALREVKYTVGFTFDSQNGIIKESPKERYTYPDHAILAAQLPIFHSMFSYNLKEKELSAVDISDMLIEAYQAFLNYIYVNVQVDEFLTHRLALLRAANKYVITDLREACHESLTEDIDTKNVFERQQIAYLYRLPKLNSSCTRYLVNFGKIYGIGDDFNAFL